MVVNVVTVDISVTTDANNVGVNIFVAKKCVVAMHYHQHFLIVRTMDSSHI